MLLQDVYSSTKHRIHCSWPVSFVAEQVVKHANVHQDQIDQHLAALSENCSSEGNPLSGVPQEFATLTLPILPSVGIDCSERVLKIRFHVLLDGRE